MSEKDQKLFSPDELKIVKQTLLHRLENIERNSTDTLSNLEKLGDDQYSDPGDRAYLESERNLNFRIRDRERKLISKVKEAIRRIENEEYQDCIECGEIIPKNRLKSRPVTNLCVNCKEKEEQDERNRKI